MPGSWCSEQRAAVSHNQLLHFRNEVQSAPGKMLYQLESLTLAGDGGEEIAQGIILLSVDF